MDKLETRKVTLTDVNQNLGDVLKLVDLGEDVLLMFYLDIMVLIK